MLASIWIPASLIGGMFQAWRTALQQRLRTELSVNGAGLVRYLYGAPLALVIVAIYSLVGGLDSPRLGGAFLFYAALGGFAQVIGTNLLIMAFGHRNFVVGTAFSKTEALQAAVFAWLALGEHLHMLVIVGIVIGVSGVLVLSLGGRKLSAAQVASALREPVALCGFGSGAAFALTAVFVKQATIELALADAVGAAFVTLATVMILQTLMQGAYVAVREPRTLRRVVETWRMSSPVGALAALGSACWFVGFATAPVALVRIVGQVEVLFTLLFAHWYLRERTKPHEAIGLVLVVLGVVFALASHFVPADHSS